MSKKNDEDKESQENLQRFLDDISSMDLKKPYVDWYQVDLLTLLNGYSIKGHEVDENSGDSIIFLNSSLLFCSPELGVARHYPKSLLHCFVEDKRSMDSVTVEQQNTHLFRGELFSITPKTEQLCWVRDCSYEHEVPPTQEKIAFWLQWLNE